MAYAEFLRPGDSFSFYSLPLYVICRISKPNIVIETGTQNGGSTQAILCALRDNEKGTLHSIDSGDQSTDGTHISTFGEPGQDITKDLKKRWNFHLGYTYDVLPIILPQLKKVDLFFHDSDHSKECVEFEFREIIQYCAKGSFVGLHDHYGQWDYTNILKEFSFVIGYHRPAVHYKDGRYHNVLRLWRKN